jgi:hypothetical protein
MTSKSVFDVGSYAEKQNIVNRESQQRIASAGGESGFGKGKVIFMAGKLADYGYENTAFAGLPDSLMQPDLDRPLAEFSVKMDQAGVPHLNLKPIDEIQNYMQIWNDEKAKANGNSVRASKEIATAGIVDSSTIDATKSLNILDRVLGLQVRDFFLMNTVTMVPANNLVFTIDTYAEGSVQEKVPELDSPQLISHTESRVTKVLYKNIGHIAISEEAEMKGSHATMQLRQDKTMKDMARVINAQIATELETASDVAGSDWGAVSGTPADSSNNPINDISGVMTTIEGNGFNVDYIAGHDRPITDLLTNKFIRGRGNVGIGTNVLANNAPSESGLPTNIIKDQALTNTIATVASKDAVWLGQGPTVVASYNNDQAGYKGWLVKQWWFPYLAQSGAIRNLTGISA